MFNHTLLSLLPWVRPDFRTTYILEQVGPGLQWAEKISSNFHAFCKYFWTFFMIFREFLGELERIPRNLESW